MNTLLNTGAYWQRWVLKVDRLGETVGTLRDPARRPEGREGLWEVLRDARWVGHVSSSSPECLWSWPTSQDVWLVVGLQEAGVQHHSGASALPLFHVARILRHRGPESLYCQGEQTVSIQNTWGSSIYIVHVHCMLWRHAGVQCEPELQPRALRRDPDPQGRADRGAESRLCPPGLQ